MIVLLIIAGFGFKIAAVPFHFWSPDVYQGAPTPVTALLSVAAQSGRARLAPAFLLRQSRSPDGPRTSRLDRLDGAPGGVGRDHDARNLAALTQTNMKRLLAYSSIAHAGYLLMGVVALSENGARGLLSTSPPTW